jgi:hypothetical protein
MRGWEKELAGGVVGRSQFTGRPEAVCLDVILWSVENHSQVTKGDRLLILVEVSTMVWEEDISR